MCEAARSATSFRDAWGDKALADDGAQQAPERDGLNVNTVGVRWPLRARFEGFSQEGQGDAKKEGRQEEGASGSGEEAPGDEACQEGPEEEGAGEGEGAQGDPKAGSSSCHAAPSGSRTHASPSGSTRPAATRGALGPGGRGSAPRDARRRRFRRRVGTDELVPIFSLSTMR